MKTAFALTVFALLSLGSGCATHRAIVPDPTVPHRVAEEGELTVWVRAPGGELVKTKVRVLPGWWVAGPPVVDLYPEPKSKPELSPQSKVHLRRMKERAELMAAILEQ